MQIYISKGGQSYGPYSIEELRHQLDSSVFTCDDCRSWNLIQAIPELGRHRLQS